MDIYDSERIKWDKKAGRLLNDPEFDWQHRSTYDGMFGTDRVLRPVYDFFHPLDPHDTTLLDYGCGGGWSTLLFAQKVRRVEAFDISENRVKVVQRRMEANGITNINARVGNGEALDYADNTFDYVFGNAILHHIPLDRCLPEIRRVLKPGGRAAFCEPLGHNPFINLYRYLKHHFWEEHLGTDKPLTYGDQETFQRYFSQVSFIETCFFSKRLPALGALDAPLLKLKSLRRFASYITVLLEKEN